LSRFVRIATGIDPLPLLLELHRADALWDQNPQRRTYPDSPHRAMVDITVRYMPEGLVNITTRRAEHRNVFWPAWGALPSLRPMVFGLMARVQATELGSIIITKLPAGGEILPHSDRGSWAPEYYNIKAHITVAGTAVTRCEDEDCRQVAGDIWTFDNLLTHSISNDGDCDRIVIIVSMRAE
jgi:hypothetical protein